MDCASVNEYYFGSSPQRSRAADGAGRDGGDDAVCLIPQVSVAVHSKHGMYSICLICGEEEIEELRAEREEAEG